MRVIIVGLGIQGKKRAGIAGADCVATVDAYQPEAQYHHVADVPLHIYDAALVCTPDECKIELLEYFLQHGKHVLVEKPLIASSNTDLEHLQGLAQQNKVTCYTAYNHRFEPHFIRMKEVLDSEILGQIYSCRLFYGNGTARDVRNSPWRDKHTGVLKDLGSHLLDTVFFWFGNHSYNFRVLRSHNFENTSPDHVVIGSENVYAIDLEMSLLSWKNHFTCDLICERGSAHIESLCKWGPSQFVLRHRKLPSGKPTEESITLVQSDPTWEIEYKYFRKICETAHSNIANDLMINAILQNLTSEVLLGIKK
ncbi:MAG: Gfo/Idh/MocA family oxidoreductase [Simkania sp.]|nr:Gfo/Idh/MocA family oxidoreductase [Simkania sp.]